MSRLSKQIITGNKLIAEFMQLKRGSCKEERWYRWDEVSQGQGYFTELKYNSSWDWLMPVVEKIESLFDDSIIVNINSGGCTIEISTQYALATNVHLPNEFYNNEPDKIINVWTSVIEFIKWYNEQKQE